MPKVVFSNINKQKEWLANSNQKPMTVDFNLNLVNFNQFGATITSLRQITITMPLFIVAEHFSLEKSKMNMLGF